MGPEYVDELVEVKTFIAIQGVLKNAERFEEHSHEAVERASL